MKQRNMTDAEMAALVGCSKSHLYQLRREDKRPSFELAGKIERVTEGAVRFHDWLDVVDARTAKSDADDAA